MNANDHSDILVDQINEIKCDSNEQSFEILTDQPVKVTLSGMENSGMLGATRYVRPGD
jgi:hypothetical protein